ncbi:MAG: hypothetical protein JNN27_02165 [Planctomycetes bacterium]|nr:hypothetical protein [Planctomycetota bacterium]
MPPISERSTTALALLLSWIEAVLLATVAEASSVATAVQTGGATSSAIKWDWSVEELASGGGDLVGCMGTSVQFRLVNSSLSIAAGRNPGAEARLPDALPTWLTLGEPYVVGDRRYPLDLARVLLALRGGARLRLSAFLVEPSAQLTVEHETPAAQLEVELRVISTVGGVTERRRFGPDFLVRAEAASRLVVGRDLSRVEVAARLRLLELADGLDEFCASADGQAGRCTNSALAEALATVVLGRAAGIRPRAQALRPESLDAARRRFAAAPCNHGESRLLSAPTIESLVCLLRCVAFADAHQLLASPQTAIDLRKHAASLQLEIEALTPDDDPLLVEWALRLARAMHEERAAIAAPLGAWANSMQEHLERDAAPFVFVPPPVADVLTAPCPTQDYVGPVDGAFALWAERSASVRLHAPSALAPDGCAECARALDSYRATMLELTAAHARGGDAWERIQREWVLPEVVLTEAGVDSRERSFACRNAQLIEAAARASVLSSRWSMGHSYAPLAR